MKRAAYALINLAHLENNFAIIKKIAKQSKIMAVVKADAYGHGMLQICKTLNGADAFSVTCVNEAMELFEGGIKKPLLALQGFSTENDLKNAIAQNIQVVIHHQEQLDMLKTFNAPQLSIYLKVDTGMHRLGFSVSEIPTILQQLESTLSPASTIRLMTHLACADEVENTATLTQLEAFDAIASNYDFEQSIANSAGLLAWPLSHRDWVRPGLALYGVSPFAPHENVELGGLLPVMSLYAPLISIKNCKKGENIGYGGDFCCPNDMVMGIIAIGYADGYPRHIDRAPNVHIGGQQTPILGRVSMDMIAVDLTGIKTHIGDVAELWGEKVLVSDVAMHAGTISYELLCAAGNAVSKKYIQ